MRPSSIFLRQVSRAVTTLFGNSYFATRNVSLPFYQGVNFRSYTSVIKNNGPQKLLVNDVNITLSQIAEGVDDVNKAIHAVIDPIIDYQSYHNRSDAEFAVTYFPKVDSEARIKEDLATRGICVFKGEALQNLIARGECVEFQHANSTVYLGAKKITHEANQELISVDDAGYGITLNSAEKSQQVNGISVVTKFDAQEIKSGSERREVRHETGFRDDLSTGSFSANCKYQLPHEPSTATGPVPHELMVDYSVKPFKSNEDLHKHRTSRMLLMRDGGIKQGVAITFDEEKKEFSYSVIQPGDVVIFKPGVWHTFAPVVTKENVQQAEGLDDSNDEYEQHMLFTSVHMDHLRENLLMDGPDTYFRGLENNLSVAARNGDLRRVEKFLRGEKPFTKVVEGNLTNVTIPAVIENGEMFVKSGKQNKGERVAVVPIMQEDLDEAIRAADYAKVNSAEIRDALLQVRDSLFPKAEKKSSGALSILSYFGLAPDSKDKTNPNQI